MADRTLRGELVGMGVERAPGVITSNATLRMLVRTKRGASVTLLLETDVQTALHARSVMKGLCATFRDLVAMLYERLA